MKYITVTDCDNLQDTLNSLTEGAHTIYLKAGTYLTNLLVNKDDITFVGESRNNTIIVSNKHANQVNHDLLPNITFRTETVKVTSSNIVFKNLTIQNASGTGPGVGQGIALSLYGNNIKVDNCDILGTHDTLFLGPLPLDLIDRYKSLNILTFDFKHFDTTNHFFINSRITGTTDFIFGSSKALFYNCEIITNKNSYIFAPSTYESSSMGIVVANSKIINTNEEPTFIARPWRNHGYLALLNNEYSGLFHPNRFDSWNKSTYRFYETPYVESLLSNNIPREDLFLINHLINNLLNS